MEETEFVIDQFMEDKDKLITAIGTAFDFIPIVKTFNIVSAMKESQNLKDYLRFLELSVDANREKIEQLSEQLTEENIKEIFYRSLSFVSKTLSDEKIKRFSNILGNSLMIAENEISKECRLDSIELCDELNDRDIVILKKVHSTVRISIKSLSKQLAKETSEVHMSCKKLESRGLIIKSEVRVRIVQDSYRSNSDDSYKSPEEIFGDEVFETTKVGDNMITLFSIHNEIEMHN